MLLLCVALGKRWLLYSLFIFGSFIGVFSSCTDPRCEFAFDFFAATSILCSFWLIYLDFISTEDVFTAFLFSTWYLELLCFSGSYLWSEILICVGSIRKSLFGINYLDNIACIPYLGRTFVFPLNLYMKLDSFLCLVLASIL